MRICSFDLKSGRARGQKFRRHELELARKALGSEEVNFTVSLLPALGRPYLNALCVL